MARTNYLRSRMDVPVFVYALETTNSDGVYVGATSTPLQLRLARHICEAFDGRKDSLPRNQWIKECVERDHRINIAELESVPVGDDWQSAEAFWIESFRVSGMKLFNETSGGLGQPGRRFSAEHREKIAAGHRGKKPAPFTAEHRQRISAGLMGRKHSEETKQKMRASHLARFSLRKDV